MKFNKNLVFLTLSCVSAVFPLGITGCTNVTPPPQSISQVAPASGQQMVQGSATPAGINHNASMSMPGMDMPGMNMPGMNHGSTAINLGPKGANFDLLWIDALIPHQQGGMIMAQKALEKSNRPEIKQVALSILTNQQKEISQLKQLRKMWYPSAEEVPMMNDAQTGQMMAMSEKVKSSLMMKMDLGEADEEFDLRFINAMTPHHQGALTMAKEALEKSDRPEIKALAQEIISSEQQEIDQMNQLKKMWYGQ